jgi:GDP-L-fucose synthase
MAPQGSWTGRPVVVTGGQGFLGSRVLARLLDLGARAVSCSRRSGCDLRDLGQAERFFRAHRPEVVFNCAAHQGGIAYQRLRPGTLFFDNVLMGTNAMEAARRAGVGRYVNIIAGCAYPGEPRDGILRESEIEAGPLHPTVENYGAAKRAALMQARCYRREFGFDAVSLVLVNLYGPGEHFHPDRSHALAALLRRFQEAEESGAARVTLWGTGRAVREWTYVDDAVEGILRAAGRHDGAEPLNIAVGRGLSIAELAEVIREVVGCKGRIEFDPSRPDGALVKVADISRMREVLGWEPPTPLREGIGRTLAWFLANRERAVAEVV